MFNRDTWKEILDAIAKNKLRTFLTGFSVALGILIFVALYGMGNGLQNTFMKFFGDDATNIFRVYPTQTTLAYGGYKAKRTIEFENEDLKDIEVKFSALLDYITPRISRYALVSYKENSDNYNTRGVGPGHMFAEKTIMMKGRYIDEIDVQEKTKYAVIGRLVEKDLFKDKESIGEYIDVGGSAFKVVGVFQDDGGDNEERYIYIPYTTRQLLEGNNDNIDQIIVAFNESIGYGGSLQFQRNLEAHLKKKKVISPEDPRGIYIENVADQLKRNQQFASVLQYIVSGIALAVIISGIIGVSNIMLFVVKERTKEIGIRKAMGATPKMITSTIMMESIFITSIFGFLGMMAGILILNSLDPKTMEEKYFIINPSIDTGTAIFVTLLLILCGAIAAYVPARRAAKIKPIVALRDD